MNKEEERATYFKVILRPRQPPWIKTHDQFSSRALARSRATVSYSSSLSAM